MKLITANKLNRFRNWVFNTLEKKLEKTRVLTTVEQVSANTNAENVASALVTGELINNLRGCSFEQEGEDFYIIGADSVRKKLGNGSDLTVLSRSASRSYTFTKTGSFLVCIASGGLWQTNIPLNVKSSGNYNILCNTGYVSNTLHVGLKVVYIEANVGDTVEVAEVSTTDPLFQLCVLEF